jgi:hypothetical protein
LWIGRDEGASWSNIARHLPEILRGSGRTDEVPLPGVRPYTANPRSSHGDTRRAVRRPRPPLPRLRFAVDEQNWLRRTCAWSTHWRASWHPARRLRCRRAGAQRGVTGPSCASLGAPKASSSR